MAIDARLETLEKKHGALKEELHLALTHPSYDDSTITDIKRRKLRVKDEIAKLREELSNHGSLELN